MYVQGNLYAKEARAYLILCSIPFVFYPFKPEISLKHSKNQSSLFPNQKAFNIIMTNVIIL